MRVVLIGSRPWAALGRPTHAPPLPTLALYHLAAVLRAAGHAVDVLDPCMLQPRSTSASVLPDGSAALRNAEVIGVSASTGGWPIARSIIREVKAQRPDVPVVVGGIHATQLPEHVLATTRADYVLRGEGEETLPRLLEHLERGARPVTVNGIAYRSRGGIFATAVPAPIAVSVVNATPDPAFDLLPRGAYSAIGVETSRGCVYACRFCAIMHKRSRRALSPERVKQKIEHAIGFAEHLAPVDGVRRIGFVDDSFAADPARAAEILKSTGTAGRAGFEVLLEARATDLMRGGMIASLSRAPVCGIQIGVECGYDAGLKAVGKGLTVQAVQDCLARMKAAGMAGKTLLSFIVGFPWERKRDCDATLDFAMRMASDYGVDCHVSWLHVYPGSELWDRSDDLRRRWGPAFFDAAPPATTEPMERVAPFLRTEDIEAIECRASLAGFLTDLAAGSARRGRVTFAPFSPQRRESAWQ
jgi:anaerobic magnesium-protoporphyrin IX monomethyl ester cyclase